MKRKSNNGNILLDTPYSQVRLFQSLIDSIPVPVFYKGTDGLYAGCNTACEQFFGRPRAEIIGKTVYDVAPREIADIYRKMDNALFNQPYVQVYETSYVRADGTKRDIIFSKAPYFFADSNLAGLIGVIFDITERKQVEEALAVSEARYRVLYENNPLMCFTVDAGGKVMQVNNKGAKDLGFGIHELIGQPVENVFYEEDKKVVMEHIRNCVANPGHVMSWELRKIHRSGGILWVREMACAFSSGEDGTYVLIVCENITEKKRVQEALKEAEEKYRNIFENAMEGIFQITAEGRFLSANPSLANINGFHTPQELIATVQDIPKQLFANPQAWKKMKNYLYRKGFVRDFEAQFYRKDGTTYWVSISARTIRSKARKIACYEGSITDITASKMAKEEILARERELKEKSQSLEEANIALRVLLRQRDVEREEQQKRITAGVKSAIIPYIDKIKKTGLTKKQGDCISMIEKNLGEFFTQQPPNIPVQYSSFTPRELEIASLIREGRTTKEIALTLNISSRSVEFHRNNIREKLGLMNRKVNLQMHLKGIL